MHQISVQEAIVRNGDVTFLAMPYGVGANLGRHPVARAAAVGAVAAGAGYYGAGYGG
jgi:hypothetical protein